MANPFGELIDNDKFDEMPRYVDKPKTQEDRAREAMNLINDKGKNSDATNYVQLFKSNNPNEVSALCVVYNGTGDALHHVADHDWHGCIGQTPYPSEIGNGQWVAFHHFHRTDYPSSSNAAVVYRGKNKDGDDCHFLIAWDVPWGPWGRNKAYCDVGAPNNFQSRWDDIDEKLFYSWYDRTINRDGCHLKVTIGGNKSPILRVVISTPYNP